MRHAVVVSLHLDPNAATPHGVGPVQPRDRRLEREPQVPHGLLGVNRNRVAAVGMGVQRLYHGFHGGIVQRGHGGVLGGSAAMIVAISDGGRRIRAANA